MLKLIFSKPCFVMIYVFFVITAFFIFKSGEVIACQDVIQEKKEHVVSDNYIEVLIDHYSRNLDMLNKMGLLEKKINSVKEFKETPASFQDPFEWVYFGNYKVALALNEILKCKRFKCYGEFFEVSFPDCIINISEKDLNYEIKDYASRLFKKYPINEELKQKLFFELQKRPICQSDVAFVTKVWTNDLTRKNLKKLEIGELAELCLLSDFKVFLGKNGDIERNTIVKKIKTPFMSGMLVQYSTGKINVLLTDEKKNISITFSQKQSDKKDSGEERLKYCVSSVQPIISKDPAMDMLLKAEEYLRDTSKPTSCIAFMFLNSAKQYKAYHTKQVKKRIEVVSKAVQKDLIKDLNSDDPNIRSACIATLAMIRESNSEQSAMRMLKDRNAKVRLKALDTLRRLEKLSPKVYLILKDDKSYEVRKENVSLLKATTYDDKDRIKFSLKALNDSHPEVRKEAINNLCWSMKINEEVLLALKELRDDPNEEVREQVEEAIFSIEFRLKDDSILK